MQGPAAERRKAGAEDYARIRRINILEPPDKGLDFTSERSVSVVARRQAKYRNNTTFLHRPGFVQACPGRRRGMVLRHLIGGQDDHTIEAQDHQ